MALDVIFTNGRIRTQDEDRPMAHSLGIHHGRVVSLDDDLPASAFDRVVDLGGAPVLPGFNDAHCHVSFVGEALVQVDLRPEVAPTRAHLLAAVGERAASVSVGEWVVGAGYDQNCFDDGAHPTAAELDAVAPDHPVWLWHNSRHMGVANTAAFAAAGLPERTGFRVPEGGGVPLDAEGRALGLLQETAKALVTDAIPAKTTEQVADQIAAACDQLLAHGITSATEPGIGAPAHIGQCVTDLAAFQLAREQGRLGVRMTVMPYLTTLHPVDPTGRTVAQELPTEGRPFGLDLGMHTGLGDDRLRIGPVKVLSDGSLIGRSAFMCADYALDAEQGASNRGLLQFAPEYLRTRLIAAHRDGWQLAVHAIGDGAVDLVLDIIAEAQERHPRPDPRHRIEHLGVASDEQIDRCVALGVVPVSQGRFVRELGDGVARALGPARTPLAYRMRSLLEAGIKAPASTDAPVVDDRPLLNIHDMVNRRTSSGAEFGPEERITVEQAVRAYTVHSAWAVHREQDIGTLAPGMLADFVVLSEDLHEVNPQHIEDVQVIATVVGGDLVHGSLD
ncbi:amidohydrolase [Kocuria sp. cx-455]|uniref:amidohydrolase n=1 Tax=Kocuria sp. cx-455 TaxID=2771377 RepID=UPI0016835CF1|nr:amidohydrolase [Kocuria sp. cx-455]MBD2763742.1 amidohydrolase [Kocuria sp. cx-455]